MVNEVQERINRLEFSIYLLEDHLEKFGNLINPRPLQFIKNQINTYKRELEIGRLYPV